jgi:4-amino-4-deoxy-L-arabinose transferase-like glycosyltransferase
MSLVSSLPSSQRGAWLCRLGAAVLILGAATFRVLFLLYDCPYDLASDEAHYWQWSQHLDWSYYSKGPLVAYLIRLGCWLFGGWSVELTGSEMVAVRLPAVFCGTILLVGLYLLTALVFRREGLALTTVAVALTLPVIAAGSTLMTIDAPFTCLWCWALVLGHRAIFGRATWAWPVLGIVVGLGILAKYNMLLWFGSLGLFLLTSPEHRQLLLRPGPWICVGLAAVCTLPILYWNSIHGWVGLFHVGSLAGMGAQTEPRLRWTGPLIFLGTQFAVLLGLWFVAWVRAMWANRPWHETDGQRRYLWWMSFGTFATFLAFSITTNGGEANWPLPAYLAGMVLTAGWLVEEDRRATGWYRTLFRGSVIAACCIGLALTVILYQPQRLTKVLASTVPEPLDANAMQVRRYDPTCRLRGWHVLAELVDREVDRLRSEGKAVIVVGGNWWLPGELAFYSKRKPEIYSVGLALGCRHSQHEFWRPNPVADPERFLGCTFVFVGDPKPLYETGAFASVENRKIYYYEGGVPIACWEISICTGFKGFPVKYVEIY